MPFVDYMKYSGGFTVFYIPFGGAGKSAGSKVCGNKRICGTAVYGGFQIFYYAEKVKIIPYSSGKAANVAKAFNSALKTAVFHGGAAVNFSGKAADAAVCRAFCFASVRNGSGNRKVMHIGVRPYYSKESDRRVIIILHFNKNIYAGNFVSGAVKFSVKAHAVFGIIKRHRIYGGGNIRLITYGIKFRAVHINVVSQNKSSVNGGRIKFVNPCAEIKQLFRSGNGNNLVFRKICGGVNAFEPPVISSNRKIRCITFKEFFGCFFAGKNVFVIRKLYSVAGS